MDKHSIMVYFNLNEVASMVKSHAFNCSLAASREIVNEFVEFITSYAPYSIVSDISANFDKLTEGGEYPDQLDGIVDLNPIHFNDRLVKSEVLSLARASFWFGFFTMENKNEDLSKDEINAKADSLYKNLKRQCSRGYDVIGRYFSFLFANRDISITQISNLSSLVLKRSESLSYKVMGIAIVLGTFCVDKKDLERTLVHFFGSMSSIIDKRTNGFQRKEVKNQVKVSFTNFLVLCKTLELVRYAEMEEAERPIQFSDVFKSFLRPFIEDFFGTAEEWFLPLDLEKEDDPSNLLTFAKEVADILELK